MKKVLTLVMVEKGTAVLLGYKKRGFGEGLWNGFGGKVEEGESIEVAAARELSEEVGLVATGLEEIGILTFTFESNDAHLEVHVYKTELFTGEPVESEEMRPQWFEKNEIPFTQMWPSDAQWFLYFLAGKKFRGAFHFDAPATPEHRPNILQEELVEVSELES